MDKGIKRVTIVAGGFSETGDEGKKVQREMAALLRQNGVRAIGPNALGPINASLNFAISFFPIQKLKRRGLSFIFQSGLYEPRLEWLFSDFNLHLCKLIDLGNKMDIHEVDALAYLSQDPETRVIAIHLESIEGNGREFLQAHSGSLAAQTRSRAQIRPDGSRRPDGGFPHRGHGARQRRVFDAALGRPGQSGRRTSKNFSTSPGPWNDSVPEIERNRLAIATLPGGEAVVVTDLCHQFGFSLSRFTEETRKKLKPVFPPWDISGNPFDLGVTLQFHDPRKGL